MGNGITGPEPPSCEGANGILVKGHRVQTQYTRDEGGDDRWYSGTIKHLLSNNRVKIKYDDGDSWTGPACYVYDLNGPPPHQMQAQHGQVPMQGQPIPMGGVVQPCMSSGAAPSNCGPGPLQARVVGFTLPQIPPGEKALGNEPACPFCSENKKDFALGCGHRLCGQCLQGVHKQGAPCPLCRAPITYAIRTYD